MRLRDILNRWKRGTIDESITNWYQRRNRKVYRIIRNRK